VLCFAFLRLVYLMLPVSLDCQFLIAPSVFSNVYLLKQPFNFSFKSASSKWYTTQKHLNYNEITWYKFLATVTFWCYLFEISFEQANIIGVQWPFFECHTLFVLGIYTFCKRVKCQWATLYFYLILGFYFTPLFY
jgi:hypothetical protein